MPGFGGPVQPHPAADPLRANRPVHPPPGHGHLRATVEGQADDTFRYGTIATDPLVIRTVMVRAPAALDNQVRQTSRGIDIAVAADAELDRTALAASLEQSLRTAAYPTLRCASGTSSLSPATPRPAGPALHPMLMPRGRPVRCQAPRPRTIRRSARLPLREALRRARSIKIILCPCGT